MRIVHLASELSGGAGIAALRLHKALLASDVASSLFYGRGQTASEGAEAFLPSGSVLCSYADRVFDQLMWRSIRQDETLFTRTVRFSRGGISELVRNADVIHLHWIAKWLDFGSLFDSIPRGTPVVLSLHDASFFSGGCHQPDSCRGFENICGSCPKIKPGVFARSSYARKGFRIRERSYSGREITAVPNSQWMKDLASGAALFANVMITSPIFPGVDFKAFTPQDRESCRKILSIPGDRFVIAAGCSDLNDPNKGIHLLLEAIKLIPEDLRCRLMLLTYGSGSLPECIDGIDVAQVGFVGSERLLSVIYSAADVFCTPSLMETFGMTVVEALACGVPVVAFETGALPEIIRHAENGWLSEIRDVAGLAEGICWLDEQKRHGRSFVKACRDSVVERFEVGRSAFDFRDLYQSITSS